jgi:transposase
VKPGEVFYYADEFNISWLPTLRAMWSPIGQQVMIPTPAQPKQLLQTLVDKHPQERIYVAWDNADTHEDEEVDAVVRAAAGRLVLLYLPTYRPWLNPIEMLWRHFRREVTHCELFATVQALLDAARKFFDRYNRTPEQVLSIIGAPNPQNS